MVVPAPRGVKVAERYLLLDVIARGGMGSVHEAIDQTTNRLRAIKLVDAGGDADRRARLEREAMIAGRVESRHVVEVVDAGYDAQLKAVYIVMERLRGEDLGAKLARVGRLSKEEAFDVAAQTAQGLTDLHEEGIVHRDLKPENVFLTRSDVPERPLVKVVDLGLAKSYLTSNPKTTRALGTPLFMAPEQLAGDGTIDPRADVYALGHLVFAMLVGVPYGTPEVARAPNLYALLLEVAQGPKEPASVRARALGVELDPAFDLWFARATSPAPAERFASCNAAILALSQALASSGEPGTTRRPRRALAAGPSAKLLRRLALASAASLGLVSALLASHRHAEGSAGERTDDRAWAPILRPIEAPASALLEGALAAPPPPAAPTEVHRARVIVTRVRPPTPHLAAPAGAPPPAAAPPHDPLDSM